MLIEQKWRYVDTEHFLNKRASSVLESVVMPTGSDSITKAIWGVFHYFLLSSLAISPGRKEIQNHSYHSGHEIRTMKI